MQEEKERQQKKESDQQIAPELGEASREEASTSTLKVKTSKGKSIEVVRVEAGEQAGALSHSTGMNQPLVRTNQPRKGNIMKLKAMIPW